MSKHAPGCPSVRHQYGVCSCGAYKADLASPPVVAQEADYQRLWQEARAKHLSMAEKLTAANDRVDDLEAQVSALQQQLKEMTAERDEAVRQHGHAVAAVDHAVTAIKTVVNVIGGTVEGAPTHRGNFLQRLNELLKAERQLAQVQQIVQEMEAGIDKIHVWSQDDFLEWINKLRSALPKE